jgi:hypothetical protein
MADEHALLGASLSGDVAKARALLARSTSLVAARNASRETPLIVAAHIGNAVLVELFARRRG